MSDLVITPSNVAIAASNARPVTVLAGATITAGMAVYLDSANSEYLPASGATESEATIAGIAVTGCADAGYFLMQTSKSYIVGATVVTGTPYYVSDSGSGKICPHSDLASGDYVTLIGHAISTTEIDIEIAVTGITV